MTRAITIILFLKLVFAHGQVEQYETKWDSEFPYFDFIPLNCPCTTKNMTTEGLHDKQLQDYKSAQYTADSLTKIYSPCYEYRARFICGIYYNTFTAKLNSLSSLDNNPTILDREIIFREPLHRDSTICPAWQIEIVKIRSIELMQQDHSGSTICDDEIN